MSGFLISWHIWFTIWLSLIGWLQPLHILSHFERSFILFKRHDRILRLIAATSPKLHESSRHSRGNFKLFDPLLILKHLKLENAKLLSSELDNFFLLLDFFG